MISIVITTSSCAKSSKIPDLRVEDYFQNKNMIKHFSGGFENGGFKQITDKIEKDKIQVVQQDTGTSVILIYQISANNNISLIYRKEELGGKSKENYIGIVNPNADDIILKAPIEVGTSWTDNLDIKYEITGINVAVNTPAGTFSAVEVTSLKDAFKSKMYYAKDLGLVKRTIEGSGEDQLIKVE